MFFYKYERQFRQEIEESKIKREKMQERQKRIDAGEVVSDTSSMKARKKEKKKAYLAKIRKQQTATSQKKSPKTIGKA